MGRKARKYSITYDGFNPASQVLSEVILRQGGLSQSLLKSLKVSADISLDSSVGSLSLLTGATNTFLEPVVF